MSEPRYRISRRLGQGGMAEVFEAEAVGEHGFTRRVAIKRMLPDAASDPRAAARFLDEAKIASQLYHGSIVAVLDVGLLDGLPFQVLELVDGIDAAELAQRAGGTLPLEVALAITRDLAHALDHAHRATDRDGHLLGIVHRDVKPSNVLLSWSGDVKLADFGIALARDRTTRTETGTVAGTLGFIAPEQRTRSEVDGRSDVFALGLTLHALITGYTPLQDITVEMALLEGAPIPIDPAIPADVKRVIEAAIAPARLARPSAADFAAAVGGLLAPRLDRDARTVVRDFVTSLANLRAPAPRGALDDLLGIEVVPVADAADAVPRFRTIAAKHAPAPAPAPAPTSAGRRPWLALALVLALLGGVAVAWRWATGSTPSPAVAAHDEATRDASLAPRVDATALAVVEPPADASPVDAAVRRVASRREDAREARRPPADARESETGWLQVVGGEALVGARVIVDGGRWQFFVPHKHEVAVGSHRVEVVMPDGTKLPVQTIEVTTFHTVRNAARLAY